MKYTTIGRFLFPPMIEKPMNWKDEDRTYDFVRVRKDYFDKAKKSKRYIVIQTPRGERIMLPKEIKGTKVYKEVFLFPDNPMSMYEVTVPHSDKKPREYFEGQS